VPPRSGGGSSSGLPALYPELAAAALLRVLRLCPRPGLRLWPDLLHAYEAHDAPPAPAPAPQDSTRYERIHELISKYDPDKVAAPLAAARPSERRARRGPRGALALLLLPAAACPGAAGAGAPATRREPAPAADGPRRPPPPPQWAPCSAGPAAA
jgi:hypothetical protein